VIRLDHVALATRDAGAALAVLVTEWDGTILFGGEAIGYRPMTVRLGDGTEGMNVELLEPIRAEENDFLERFLVRHGEGPHHLTFKVDSLAEMLDRVRAAGLSPVGVDTADPTWQEAFLQPREAHGTVVQLAQSTWDAIPFADLYATAREQGPDAHPQWWPEVAPGAGDGRVVLRRVVLESPDIAATLAFYQGLLEGEIVERGEGWAELTWPGGAHVRVEAGRGPAGITRLEATGAGPRREVVVAGARLVIEPPG
jgi:methylmalonyl-CoA/ethylmalonyl-CoA epimerase